MTAQEIQSWVSRLQAQGYTPKTVDHLHDVLSAVLRTAVKWGHLESNPARAVDLPRLVTVRPKWALTPSQASHLLDQLPPLPKAMVAIALLTGLRRGELFALRWKAFDPDQRGLHISEAVYEGAFSTPKTAAGTRTIPLSDSGIRILLEWRQTRKSRA